MSYKRIPFTLQSFISKRLKGNRQKNIFFLWLPFSEIRIKKKTTSNLNQLQMKKLLLSIIAICSNISLISCGDGCSGDEVRTQVIYNHNVKIVQDLSNRITQLNYKPVLNDKVIVDHFFKIVPSLLFNESRSVNQQDVYKIDFINKNHLSVYNVNPEDLEINLSRFGKKQMDRIKYLGGFKAESEYKKDESRLLSQFQDLQLKLNVSNDHGSDIYSYFQNLNNLDLDFSTEKGSINGELNVESRKMNEFVLLTDGYLEASAVNDNNKMSKDLSEAKINNFRKEYNKARILSPNLTIEEYLTREGWGITPLTNKLLKKDVKILVMQLFDRGATSGKNKNFPSDLEIIKLFWSKWLVNSGIKPRNFRLLSTYEVTNSSQIDKIYHDFFNFK